MEWLKKTFAPTNFFNAYRLALLICIVSPVGIGLYLLLERHLESLLSIITALGSAGSFLIAATIYALKSREESSLFYQRECEKLTKDLLNTLEHLPDTQAHEFKLEFRKAATIARAILQTENRITDTDHKGVYSAFADIHGRTVLLYISRLTVGQLAGLRSGRDGYHDELHGEIDDIIESQKYVYASSDFLSMDEPEILLPFENAVTVRDCLVLIALTLPYKEAYRTASHLPKDSLISLRKSSKLREFHKYFTALNRVECWPQGSGFIGIPRSEEVDFFSLNFR